MSKPTYEQLETQVKQLAAENSGLKSFKIVLRDIRSSLIAGGKGYMAAADAQAQNAVLDVVFDAFDGIETPATDAFIDSIRDQAYPDHLDKLADHFDAVMKRERTPRRNPQSELIRLIADSARFDSGSISEQGIEVGDYCIFDEKYKNHPCKVVCFYRGSVTVKLRGIGSHITVRKLLRKITKKEAEARWKALRDSVKGNAGEGQ